MGVTLSERSQGIKAAMHNGWRCIILDNTVYAYHVYRAVHLRLCFEMQ